MYINILHLIWIVPLSAIVGIFFTALVAVNGKEDDK